MTEPAYPRAIVLLEGESDRQAVLAFAGILGVALDGVAIVATDGITNFAKHIARAVRDHSGVPVFGLYDAGEERAVRRALTAGLEEPGRDLTGFHRCDVDLEDELIRALGIERAVALVEDLGEGARFRKMQHQPAWRGMPLSAQLHRFMGIRSGRKKRYAGAFARATPPDAVPAAIRSLLEAIMAISRPGQ